MHFSSVIPTLFIVERLQELEAIILWVISLPFRLLALGLRILVDICKMLLS